MRRRRKEGPNKFLEQDLFALLAQEPPDYGEDYALFAEALNEKQRQFIVEHPLGLTQAELSFNLDTADDFLEHCVEKISQASPDLLESFGFEELKLSAHQAIDESLVWNLEALARELTGAMQRCSLWELQRIFSFQEIARLYHERQFSGRLGDQIYSHPYQTYVAKLALSTWHWYTPYEEDCLNVSWKRVMDFHKFFTGFDFGLSGFEVTIDHSISWMNTKGPATYADSARFYRKRAAEEKEVWLDGEFGLLVSVKGEHVLTIGVSPTNAGLLVNQIQLRKEKGNRWLYKLGKSYFEYVLERLYLACTEANLDLFFVTAESLLPYLKGLHTEKNPWKGSDERIARLYNQPLPGFEQGSEKMHANGLEYFSLRLVQELPLAMVA